MDLRQEIYAMRDKFKEESTLETKHDYKFYSMELEYKIVALLQEIEQLKENK